VRTCWQHRPPQYYQVNESVHKLLTTAATVSCAIVNRSPSIPSVLTSITAKSLLRLLGPCIGRVLISSPKSNCLGILIIANACQMPQPSTSILAKNLSHLFIHSKTTSQFSRWYPFLPLLSPGHTQTYPNAAIMKALQSSHTRTLHYPCF